MEVVFCQQGNRFFYQIRKQALWKGHRGQCELEVRVCACVCVSPPPPLHPYCHSPKASLLNWLTDNKIIQESTATETFVPQSNSLTCAITPGLHLKHWEVALNSASEQFSIEKRWAFNKYLDHEIRLNFSEAASTLFTDHELNNAHLFRVWHWCRAKL